MKLNSMIVLMDRTAIIDDLMLGIFHDQFAASYSIFYFVYEKYEDDLDIGDMVGSPFSTYGAVKLFFDGYVCGARDYILKNPLTK